MNVAQRGRARKFGFRWFVGCLALCACSGSNEPVEIGKATQALVPEWNGGITQFRTLFNVTNADIVAQTGYRVVDLDIVSASPLRYNTVMVQNTGTFQRTWALHPQLTWAQLNVNWAPARPILVKPYLLNNSVVYSVVVSQEPTATTFAIQKDLTLAAVKSQATALGKRVIELEPMPIGGVDKYVAVFDSGAEATTVLTHTDPDGIMTWLDDNPGRRLFKWRRLPWAGWGYTALAIVDPTATNHWEKRRVTRAQLDHLYGRYVARPIDLTPYTESGTQYFDALLIDNGPHGSVGGSPFGGSPAYDNRIANFMKRNGVPGVSLAVVKSGRLVYAKAYGNARIAEPGVAAAEPATPNTLMRVGSVSKTVAAIAYLRAVQLGSTPTGGQPLTLDTRVFRDVLKGRIGAPITPANATALDAITARQIMQHVAGFDGRTNPITDTANVAQNLGIQTTPTCAQTVRWMLDKPPENAPNVDYEYYNTGPCIIAATIEVATGMTYENFLNTHVFQPLGLVNRIVRSSDYFAQRVANEAKHYASVASYLDGRDMVTPRLNELASSWFFGFPVFNTTVPEAYGGVPLINGTAPGGLAASTVAFARLLSGIDGTGPTQILTAQSFQEMKTASALAGYGLFMSLDWNGDLSHGGSVAGGFAHYVIKEADDVIWVATANSTEWGCAATAYDLVNFGGASYCLGPGRYNRFALGPNGMNVPDNFISSIKLADGVSVELYKDDEFSGTLLRRSESDPTLGDNSFDNSVTSFAILPYQGGDLGGVMHEAYEETKSGLGSATWNLFPTYGL